jgi:two-component sensor histidine kinase
MARAHDLTISGEADGNRASTDLLSLVRAILSPYEADHREGLEIAGPEVSVGGSALTPLALVLHELATNAAKYGALSSPQGRLTVELVREDETVTLHWRERGGPAIAGVPAQVGFGSKLEKATLTGLGATIEREWNPEGLSLSLIVRVERLNG